MVDLFVDEYLPTEKPSVRKFHSKVTCSWKSVWKKTVRAKIIKKRDPFDFDFRSYKLHMANLLQLLNFRRQEHAKGLWLRPCTCNANLSSKRKLWMLRTCQLHITLLTSDLNLVKYYQCLEWSKMTCSKQIMDIYGHHAAVCPVSGDRIKGHNALRDFFDDFCTNAAWAVKEKPFLVPFSSERPADIFIPNFTDFNFCLQ